MPTVFRGQLEARSYSSGYFTEEAFVNSARKEGWTGDKEIDALKKLHAYIEDKIQDKIDDYSENYFKNGRPAVDTVLNEQELGLLNAIDDIYMHHLGDTDTSGRYTDKGTRKKQLLQNTLQFIDDPDLKNELQEIIDDPTTAFNQQKLAADHLRGEEEFGNSISQWQKYDEDLHDLLKDAYRGCVDADGRLYAGIETAVKRARWTMFEEGDDLGNYQKEVEELQEIKKAIERAVPDENKRSFAQKQVMEKLNARLAPEVVNKETARLEAVSRDSGFFKAGIWFGKVYDLRNLPEVKNNPEHPLHKCFEEMDKGTIKEFPGYQRKGGAFGLAYQGLLNQHLRTAMESLTDSKEKSSALQALDECDEELNKHKMYKVQQACIPYHANFAQITSEAQEKCRRMVENIEKVADNDDKAKDLGIEKTEEYEAMIKGIKDFANVSLLYGGSDLMEQIPRTQDAIEKYVQAEKQRDPERTNPIVPAALEVMNYIDPKKAIDHRKEIAANLCRNLQDEKKAWYVNLKFGKDTEEFTNFRKALEDFSKMDMNDPNYKTTAEKLATMSKNYITAKKGGLTVEATNERRKMAILALSLVRPEEAMQMVNEANIVRKANNIEEIDLVALQEKAGFGGEKDTKKRSKEAPELKTKITLEKLPPQKKGPSMT